MPPNAPRSAFAEPVTAGQGQFGAPGRVPWTETALGVYSARRLGVIHIHFEIHVPAETGAAEADGPNGEHERILAQQTDHRVGDLDLTGLDFGVVGLGLAV